MKVFLKLIIVFTISFGIFSCSNDQNTNTAIEQNRSTDKVELISPNGFKLADSKNELKKIIGLENSTTIEKIEYLEYKNISASIIHFKKKNEENTQSIAIGKGEINVNSSELQYSKNIMLDKEGPSWIVKCKGCSGCKVGGVITDDGVSFNCSKSCCHAEITQEN